jgi:hypothetical protein
MNAILHKIMSHKELVKKPPVLVDIGASGGLVQAWHRIAPYSICLACEANDQAVFVPDKESKTYRKIILLNKLLASEIAEAVDFYVTKSPNCSSSLKPNYEALKPWAFKNLFEVDKVIQLPSVDLKCLLSQADVTYIDWYKADTQGTDLRIFSSLPKNIIEKIIVAEFEPGLIDAYIGEDKLHHILSYMDKKPFWITSMNIKGSHRIEVEDMASLNSLQHRSLESFLKFAPGWCEISYLNKFEDKKSSARDLLLAWVFATIKKEYGFALRVAKIGREHFDDQIFAELILASSKSLRKGYTKIALKMFKRLGRVRSKN